LSEILNTIMSHNSIVSAQYEVMVILFTATFKNIAATSWRSVLLMYSENTTDLPQVTDKLYHIMLYWVRITLSRIRTRKLGGDSTDYAGSCKSNYHKVMTTTDLLFNTTMHCVWSNN